MKECVSVCTFVCVFLFSHPLFEEKCWAGVVLLQLLLQFGAEGHTVLPPEVRTEALQLCLCLLCTHTQRNTHAQHTQRTHNARATQTQRTCNTCNAHATHTQRTRNTHATHTQCSQCA